jgi:hypothetical protein
MLRSQFSAIFTKFLQKNWRFSLKNTVTYDPLFVEFSSVFNQNRQVFADLLAIKKKT